MNCARSSSPWNPLRPSHVLHCRVSWRTNASRSARKTLRDRNCEPGPKRSKIVVTHQSLDQFRLETQWETYRCSRNMRGMEEETVWYCTCGPFAVDEPPASLIAEVDNIYVHRQTPGSKTSMWVLDRDHRWSPLQEGGYQPSNTDRRLAVCKDGDLSWVTVKTYRVYRSRDRKATRETLLQNKITITAP